MPKRHTLTGNNHRNSDDETPSKVIPNGRVLAELAVSTKSPLPEGEDSHNRKLKRALGAPTPAGLRKAEGPFAVRPGSRLARHSCCKERPVGFLSPKARNSRHFGCELFQGHSPVQYTPCLCKVRKACPDRYRLMWSRTVRRDVLELRGPPDIRKPSLVLAIQPSPLGYVLGCRCSGGRASRGDP